MIDITAPLQSHEFETAPEGTQPAVCSGVILIGTIETKQWGPKKKIRIIFELHGEEKMRDGRPFMVSQDFTFSSNENAALRIFIEDWRGKKYSNAELKQIGGLPISKLLGHPALVSVTHTQSDDGNVWANIKSIMPPPKGLAKPELSVPGIIYSVDAHDQTAFDKLSPKLQDKIKSSREWKVRTGEIKVDQGQPKLPIPDDFNDEIPF